MKNVCKQCGEAKIQAEFRPYYGKSTKHYKVCYECEKVNSRRKYLEGKADKTKEEQDELLLIYQLYEAQRKRGLAPPRQGMHERGLKSTVSAQLHKLTAESTDLSIWLTKDLAEYNPDQLNEIYEGLRARYRPTIGLEPTTCLPIYDDKYKDILDKILVRFDDREEEYYAME